MTEAEWATATDPAAMLEFLRNSEKATDRKFRLFACACCRAIWPLFPHDLCRKAIEVAEWYSDGLATVQELWSALDDAQGYRFFGKRENDSPTNAVIYAASPDHFERYKGFRPGLNPIWVANSTMRAVSSSDTRFASKLGDLLRDIFGNPFRPAPIALSLLDWHNGRIVQLAQEAYDNRILPSGNLDRERLGVLADALERAGCGDADILSHLRGETVHVRGCHVIDLLLGKS